MVRGQPHSAAERDIYMDNVKQLMLNQHLTFRNCVMLSHGLAVPISA